MHRDAADVRPVERARSWANRLAAGLGEIAAGAEIVGQPGARRHVRPEGQQALVGSDAGRLQPHRPRRRIVAGELAGRFAAPIAATASGIAQRDRARSPPRSPRAWRRRDAARSASAVVRSSTLDSRPTAQGPPSRISGTRSPSDLATCSAPGRADGAAAVGRGRRDRPAGGADQRLRHRMARARGPPPCRAPAVASSAMAEPLARGSTSVSGPGQKRAASLSAVSLQCTQRCACAGIEHVGDQRIELRPALGLEDRWRRRVRWWRRRPARRPSRSGKATSPPSPQQSAASAIDSPRSASTSFISPPCCGR